MGRGGESLLNFKLFISHFASVAVPLRMKGMAGGEQLDWMEWRGFLDHLRLRNLNWRHLVAGRPTSFVKTGSRERARRRD